MIPQAAPTEQRLRMMAFSGSSSDRNSRAKKMNVMTPIISSISGNDP